MIHIIQVVNNQNFIYFNELHVLLVVVKSLKDTYYALYTYHAVGICILYDITFNIYVIKKIIVEEKSVIIG